LAQKFIKLDWPKEEQLNEVKKPVNYQKLKKFLAFFGTIYPDLTRVFYTNVSQLQLYGMQL